MQTWAYRIFQSNGGTVTLPSGAVPVIQMLNLAGSQGGELVAVVTAGPNVYEWVIKFPKEPQM
jgi:hypothetical protein